MTLTDVPGIKVGHWTDKQARTGCTVIVLPQPNVVSAEVRGAAPGTRETALLAPGMRVEQVDAILLTGGSAFGLAAADGVVTELEKEGRGHPTPAGPVPIVPAAVVFDLMTGDGSVRPTARNGASAYRNASNRPVSLGLVGAGTGTTVAKWRGFEFAAPGGIGSWARRVGRATVGGLVVLNSVGDVFTLEGEPLTGGSPVPKAPAAPPIPAANTTLVVVATDARLTRPELARLCVRAHDAIGACLRPAHTRYDGDVVFAVSCGRRRADLDALGEAAFEVTGRAIEATLTASAVQAE
jgi:L-aminopeptidase/D-esterase-like protein